MKNKYSEILLKYYEDELVRIGIQIDRLKLREKSLMKQLKNLLKNRK